MVCILLVSCGTSKSDNLLHAPETWRKEVLEFPLLFAKSLPYIGEEHIRFAEGWGEPENEEYFSYVFLWILEEDPNLDATKIASDMETYFTGLMKMRLLSKLRFFKKLPKTKAAFTLSGSGNKRFEGSIDVYDAFFAKETIRLYVKVSSSYCTILEKHLVYFRLSPKAFSNIIWTDLEEVTMKPTCSTQN